MLIEKLLSSQSSVKELRIERGSENSGHDRVHAHPVSCPFDSHSSSQGRERRLAGAIGGHFIESKERPKGCNVNDPSVAAFHHVAAKNLTGAQSARQVCFKNLVPFPFIRFEDRHALGTAGGIDQDVHLAKSLHRGIQQAPKRGTIRHVRRYS
jgi:hypothetical protein